MKSKERIQLLLDVIVTDPGNYRASIALNWAKMTFLEEYGTIFAFEPLQVVFLLGKLLGLEFERSDLYDDAIDLCESSLFCA